MILDVYYFQLKEWIRKLTKESWSRSTHNYSSNKWTSLSQAITYVKQHGWSLRIHKEDWQFQEERTYPKSADPTSSKW